LSDFRAAITTTTATTAYKNEQKENRPTSSKA